MQFRQAILVADRQTYQLVPGKPNSFETFFADFQCDVVSAQETKYSIFLHPKQDITLQRLEIQLDMPLSAAARFFANGSINLPRWCSVPTASKPTGQRSSAP